jgi:hypothetical protein
VLCIHVVCKKRGVNTYMFFFLHFQQTTTIQKQKSPPSQKQQQQQNIQPTKTITQYNNMWCNFIRYIHIYVYVLCMYECIK